MTLLAPQAGHSLCVTSECTPQWKHTLSPTSFTSTPTVTQPITASTGPQHIQYLRLEPAWLLLPSIWVSHTHPHIHADPPDITMGSQPAEPPLPGFVFPHTPLSENLKHFPPSHWFNPDVLWMFFLASGTQISPAQQSLHLLA